MSLLTDKVGALLTDGQKSDVSSELSLIGFLRPGLFLLWRPAVDFGGVAGVVEFQEAVQDLLADYGADGVTGALAGVVEAVVQARLQQISPAVGADHCLVDRKVDVTEFRDVCVGTLRVVHQVVRRCQARLPGPMASGPAGTRRGDRQDVPHLGGHVRERKRLEHVRRERS